MTEKRPDAVHPLIGAVAESVFCMSGRASAREKTPPRELMEASAKVLACEIRALSHALGYHHDDASALFPTVFPAELACTPRTEDVPAHLARTAMTCLTALVDLFGEQTADVVWREVEEKTLAEPQRYLASITGGRRRENKKLAKEELAKEAEAIRDRYRSLKPWHGPLVGLLLAISLSGGTGCDPEPSGGCDGPCEDVVRVEVIDARSGEVMDEDDFAVNVWLGFAKLDLVMDPVDAAEEPSMTIVLHSSFDPPIPFGEVTEASDCHIGIDVVNQEYALAATIGHALGLPDTSTPGNLMVAPRDPFGARDLENYEVTQEQREQALARSADLCRCGRMSI